MTEKTLVTILETVKKPWVYISGPTINPTGLLYSNKEIENILTVCAKYGARVVIDTAFSGLEFNYEGWGGWDLEGCLSKLYSSTNSSFNVSLLGGLSLKMLTGALKFGFLVLNHPQLVDAFSSFPGLSKPHSTVRYAIKKLLGLRERKARDLMNAVAEHIRNLESRSKRLKEALENCGWEVVQSCGGVSMVAKPSAYLNKTVKISRYSSGSGEKTATEQIKLDDSNIREAIVKATGLCINSGSWTGIPGYCRFTFALEESEFERALDCIAKFKSIVRTPTLMNMASQANALMPYTRSPFFDMMFRMTEEPFRAHSVPKLAEEMKRQPKAINIDEESSNSSDEDIKATKAQM
ncbi:hypothetical protein CUMW_264740 [Citrus unshiu]|uniref:Aminotransferase class I/classII large domain-containing protein n=1 Tax=Citrus unshiu TaxID=55188 RepID=A0A2H5QV59_CITUN|nr:hypothetical protein CUMW_264740 [Citrus unshiu]